MPSQVLENQLSDVFSRLEGAACGALAVLTPNRRLAQSLLADYDRRQLAAGRSSWEAPDILPFAAFLERCHEEASFVPLDVPALLSAAEEQILWEESVRASAARDSVLSVPATAALAAQAWSLAHAWRIEGALDGHEGSEDAEAFAAWRAHYARRTSNERLVDAARLPALVASLLAGGRIPAPRALVLHAFDLVTPQQDDFIGACVRAGIEVVRTAPAVREARVMRTTFESPRHELEGAARWARARLERSAASPAPRIAVVVPDLAQRRAEVLRVFSRVLGPCFNVSLGTSLAASPLVDAALAILELCSGPMAGGRVSRLLRSPFIAGAQAELAQRARLDAALRRLAPATLSLARLRALLPEAAARRGAPACPQLVRVLDGLVAASADAGRAPPHEWARRFTARLDAAGFPGDRGLDSTEYQTLARWRELLATLATLGSVAPSWNAGQARMRLQRLAGDTLFQPATADAPVQVLGILESAGLAFDHLWVSGLTEEAWPLAARAHPLIAASLQRRAGIPQATPERSLALDRRLTLAWRGAAAEVVFTSARADGDRELLPSPLVADIVASPVADLALAPSCTLRDALFTAGRAPGAVTSRPDPVAPALGTGTVQGGTAILADQAACPFRAFAHFRLEARALERPEPGLGTAERGQLLHAMMARLWSGLRDQATLLATDAARLAEMIEEAAAHAVARVRAERPGRLEGRFAELERERLAALAHDWLEIERRRAPFEVRLSEAKMTLAAGELRLEGRVDRIDRLLDGGLAVIDYKSGAVSVSSWLGERPDDAQLPLYALAAGEQDVRAVAFARLKTGQLGFAGLARDEGLLPGVKTVARHVSARRFAADWAQLQAAWREQVRRLGEDFAGGDARVDPKRSLATCERCDLKPLCRVNERLGALVEDGAVEEEAE